MSEKHTTLSDTIILYKGRENTLTSSAGCDDVREPRHLVEHEVGVVLH